MKEINNLLQKMVQMQASDLHLKNGSTAIVRLNRELIPIGSDILTSEDIQSFLKEIFNENQFKKFREDLEIDFAYAVPDIGRFRTNVFLQRGSISIAMRFVKFDIPVFSELHIPLSLEDFCSKERGLILITGATNSGKSTTLAAMIDYINRHFRKHIITVEDPIEFLHQDRLSIINQREVGIDTLSFDIALKHILRQDPDVILIGEMRDKESFTAALQAAETGHLVMSTMHASSASNAIDRILDFFHDPILQEQARLQLANNLISIVSQRLLPRKDGNGLIPALEILTGNPTVKRTIHKNELNKISQIIASTQDSDMMSFNQSILSLIKKGLIKEDIGLAHADNPEVLKMNIQGIFLDEERRIVS